MPKTRDIRLARDYKGRKAGDIVTVTNEEYVAALQASVVRKTYPAPVRGVEKHRLSTPVKKAPGRKRSAKQSTPEPSAAAGDEK